MIVNPNLVADVLFVSIMGFAGIIVSFYLLSKNKNAKVTKMKMESPFTLKPALTFVTLFTIIIFFTQLLTTIFGNSGLYFIALFSGFLDVDAITLTLAKMAKEHTITNFTAASAIFIASVSNTVFKGGIAYYLGTKQLSKLVIGAFFIIIFVGLLSLFLI